MTQPYVLQRLEVYDLEWVQLSGSHGNIGPPGDIDFELDHIAPPRPSAALGPTVLAFGTPLPHHVASP